MRRMNQSSRQSQYRLQALPGGNAGVRRTLEVLRGLRDKYAQDISIRQAAEKIVAGLVADNDVSGQVDRVTQFVKNKVRYMRDPLAWEYVKTPDTMLKQINDTGNTYGDCDDHVLLMNTLLNTLGIKTRFTAVVINGSPTFNHVISSVLIGRDWVDIDPCAKVSPQPFFPIRLVV